MNNYSKQREIILEVIRNSYEHLTAEELYNLVVKDNPKISKSTVYRNISILLDKNIIRKVKMISGPDRYDYITNEHYHAICEICGRVYDFIYPFDNKSLIDKIKSQTGIIIRADSITIYGICEECKSKMKEEL